MGGHIFGILYNNFAPIKEVVVCLSVGILLRDYLRNIPALHYTIDRYDCH